MKVFINAEKEMQYFENGKAYSVTSDNNLQPTLFGDAETKVSVALEQKLEVEGLELVEVKHEQEGSKFNFSL